MYMSTMLMLVASCDNGYILYVTVNGYFIKDNRKGGIDSFALLWSSSPNQQIRDIVAVDGGDHACCIDVK